MARMTAMNQAVLLHCLLVIGFLMPTRADMLRFNALSPEKEAAMGVSEFEKIKRQKPIVTSGANYQAVQRVAGRLVPVVSVPNASWEFVVFQDATPNAFALPGGKVGVHTGLFKVVQNDGQLAAVLGHELAHVTARHSGQRITQGVAGATIGAIAGKVLENKTGMDQRTAQAITGTAATLRLLKFSRKQELEADQLGAKYMARAGYDPNEAVTLWTNFAAYKAKAGGSSLPAFLSTHPVDSRRIEELKAYLPVAMAEYNQTRGGGRDGAVAPVQVTETAKADPPAATRPRESVSLRDLFRRQPRTR
jgi:predicted Zn-dependent protease